jgi:hypothetical protein
MIYVAMLLMVVSLSLPRKRYGKWFGYICSPKRFDDLHRRLEDKIKQLGINLETRVPELTSGEWFDVASVEWHDMFPEP